MPEWLIQILIQYPIVVVVGFVTWYAYRELKSNNADHLKREREIHTDAIAGLKAAHERLLAAKDSEITRLAKELKDEVRKLGKVVAELNERLSP